MGTECLEHRAEVPIAKLKPKMKLGLFYLLERSSLFMYMRLQVQIDQIRYVAITTLSNSLFCVSRDGSVPPDLADSCGLCYRLHSLFP
jgi:hypothetical protein